MNLLSANQFPSIAVLVLTYNHQAYIEDCLQSILKCDYPNMHITVLEDGSTDNTKDIIKKIANNDARVTLLTQENSGGKISQNTQRLIDETQSDYVMLMSGDDLLGPVYSIKNVIFRMENDSTCDAVFPRMIWMSQYPDQKANFTYSKSLYEALRSGNPYDVLVKHLYRDVSDIFLQGLIIRRSVLKEIGNFDSGLIADDYAFIFRLFNYLHIHKRQFYFEEKNLWLYRIHNVGIHDNALRQFSLIVEVVATYLPPEQIKNFHWHFIVLKTYPDFCKFYEFCYKLLEYEDAKGLLAKTMLDFYRFSSKSGNKEELKKIMSDKRFTFLLRLKSLFNIYLSI